MSEQATTESGLVDRRKPRGRSPNYPGISLGTAIDKARKLYESERRHAAPISVVTSIWGYSSPTTGYATVAVAALKKYGLLLDEKADGERLLRLSELAMDILLNPEPREAIQQAALLPPLHKEMWETYGSRLPSFDTLRWMLVKRGFTESGVQDFLRVYRETITFAKLDAGVVKPIADEAEPTTVDEEEHDAPYATGAGSDRSSLPSLSAAPGSGKSQTVAQSNGLRIPIPLVGGTEVVVIEGQFPLTEQAWAQFMAMITVMKPGLVKPDDA